MIENKSYLLGPKLGDLIHSLVVCKYNYDTFGYKADLYLSSYGGSFEYGLQFTYNELKPILSEQDWVNSFKIYNAEHVDVNLTFFRYSSFLYKTNWNEIYFNQFLEGATPPKEYSWIKMPKDESLSNIMLINRSVRPLSEKVQSHYRNVLDNNKDLKKVFICFEESQYENFIYKDECELLKIENLYEYFKKINSCKLFLGNQSGPLAWATSMNVPRVAELMNEMDANHYIKDSEYYSNFKWFRGDINY